MSSKDIKINGERKTGGRKVKVNDVPPGGDSVEPPSVQIDTNLEDNPMIREYMMMRENQFKTAMVEKFEAKSQPKKPQFQENGGQSENPKADKKSDREGKTSENFSLANIAFDKYALPPISEEEKKILDMFVDGN